MKGWTFAVRVGTRIGVFEWWLWVGNICTNREQLNNSILAATINLRLFVNDSHLVSHVLQGVPYVVNIVTQHATGACAATNATAQMKKGTKTKGPMKRVAQL